MPAKRSSSRFCARARHCVALVCSHVGLLVLVAAYLLLGAFVFEFLESKHELEQRENIKKYRDQCLRELWTITERLNVLYEKNWTVLVHEQLRKFETSVVEAASVQGYDGKDLMDRDQQWSFSGALLYSVTVITTIGYGNLAPKTAAGKIVTMIYALFGVPLLLLCLSNLGSLLADTFLFAYSHSCCSGHKHRQTECKERYSEPVPPPPPAVRNTMVRMGSGGRPVCQLTPEARHVLAECAEYQLAHTCSDPSATSILRQLNGAPPDEFDDDSICVAVHDTPSRVPLIWRDGGRPPTPPSPPPAKARPAGPPLDPPRVPVSLVLVVLVGYICLGAAIFAAWEEWTYLDGAYFCFVTLSTIGFGDLVPGKSFQRPDTQDGQLQLVACCIYLLIGLVLIAMSFSLVQETVAAKSRQLAMCIGLLSQDQDS